MILEIIFINILNIIEFILLIIVRKNNKYSKRWIFTELLMSIPYDMFTFKISIFSLIKMLKIVNILRNHDQIFQEIILFF